MLHPEFKPTNLQTIADGSISELFERELAEVMDNIDDPNTPASEPRKITIEITFKPDEQREAIQTQVCCKAKLASVNPHISTIFAVRDDGKLKAVNRNQKQGELFNKKIVPILGKGE